MTVVLPHQLGQDWSNPAIKCALEEAGHSMRQLSIQNRLSANTLNNALRMPYPKAERIIAKAIGVAPELIWPSRYAKRNSRAQKGTIADSK